MPAHKTTALAALGASAVAALSPNASAQFSTISPGNVVERIAGEALPGLSADTVEAGDQLGAFFNDTLIGSFSFTSQTGSEFDITLSGDNPATPGIEGPQVGQPVEFRFFDSSTNFVLNNIRVETVAGERFNFTFQGADLTQILTGGPLPLPIEFFVPSRSFNVRITEGGGAGVGGFDGGGDGAGDDDAPPGAGFDVNGDGEVTREDAALVIRAIGASNVPANSPAADLIRSRFVTAAQLQAADVNGDGAVSSRDVMAVIREIQLNDRPDSSGMRPTPSGGDDAG